MLEHPNSLPDYAQKFETNLCDNLSMCLKTATWVTNSVDPDQMPHSVIRLGVSNGLKFRNIR